MNNEQPIGAKTKAGDTAAAPTRKADKYLWAIYLCLLLVSLVEQYSAASREVQASHIMQPMLHHATLLALGLIVTLVVSRIPYKWFIPLIPLFVLASVVCAIYVLVAGDVLNGAARSFRLLGIPIQPAELLKLSAVMLIALVMSRSQLKEGGVSNRGLWFCAGVVLLFGGLLFTQGLSNTALLMIISIIMILLSGVKWRQFLAVVGIYFLIGGCAAGYKLATADKEDKTDTQEQVLIAETGRDAQGNRATIDRSHTWINRIKNFFDNDTTPRYNRVINDGNSQELHSYWAQANGGIWGVGPGNSRQAARLPLANVDFIYAIVVEDTGLIGGLAVLMLYLFLLARAGSLTTRCQRAFPALLVMGMAVYVVLQALCHMAIVTGAMPVSGQPLPLISKGGTSIVTTSLAIGIMMSVSRYAVRRSTDNPGNTGTGAGDDNEGLPDELAAHNPSLLQPRQ